MTLVFPTLCEILEDASARRLARELLLAPGLDDTADALVGALTAGGGLERVLDADPSLADAAARVVWAAAGGDAREAADARLAVLGFAAVGDDGSLQPAWELVACPGERGVSLPPVLPALAGGLTDDDLQALLPLQPTPSAGGSTPSARRWRILQQTRESFEGDRLSAALARLPEGAAGVLMSRLDRPDDAVVLAGVKDPVARAQATALHRQGWLWEYPGPGSGVVVLPLDLALRLAKLRDEALAQAAAASARRLATAPVKVLPEPPPSVRSALRSEVLRRTWGARPLPPAVEDWLDVDGVAPALQALARTASGQRRTGRRVGLSLVRVALLADGESTAAGAPAASRLLGRVDRFVGQRLVVRAFFADEDVVADRERLGARGCRGVLAFLAAVDAHVVEAGGGHALDASAHLLREGFATRPHALHGLVSVTGLPVAGGSSTPGPRRSRCWFTNRCSL